MKKLFALLAVVSLAAVGCQDSKTSNKPSTGTGGTYEKTHKVESHTTAHVTDTVKVGTETVTKVGTVHATVTETKPSKPEGPATPPKGDSNKPKGEGK